MTLAPSAADLTAPARIPKLKYRNPLPADQLSLSSRDSAIHPQQKTSLSLSDATSTLSRTSFETASLTSSSLASTRSSNGSSSDSTSATKRKKKKSSSVFGFLSLKEPSQVALEQFAEQQRRQDSAKTSSTSASSIKSNTINSKKLPPTVPKVTSKWDGIPSSAKNRNSASARSTKDTHSLSSREPWSLQSPLGQRPDSRFSVMTDASQGPPNSMASAAPSMVDISVHVPTHHVPSSSFNTPPADVPYYSPDEPTPPTLPVSPLTSDTVSGTIARPPLSLPVSTPSLDTPPDEYINSRSSSRASSTDSADTIVRDTADAIFKRLNDRPRQSLLGAQLPTGQSPEEETDDIDQDEDGVPESHDFLFDIPPTTEQQQNGSSIVSPPVPCYAPQRPVQNFSRLMHTSNTDMPPPAPRVAAPSLFRQKPAGPGLPTLYEGSVASTESFETVRNNSDAQSIAASSIAPSVLSEQWHQNPRDRLGLGGRLRKGDAPRWKTFDESPGKPRKNLLSFLVRSRS